MSERNAAGGGVPAGPRHAGAGGSGALECHCNCGTGYLDWGRSELGAPAGWPEIVRKSADFTMSCPPDGKAWKVIKTVTLPKMPATLHAGFVIYAIPSATNRVHWARFDHISLTP